MVAVAVAEAMPAAAAVVVVVVAAVAAGVMAVAVVAATGVRPGHAARSTAEPRRLACSINCNKPRQD